MTDGDYAIKSHRYAPPHEVAAAGSVVFDDGAEYSLPFEYLRVYSPSAEVRGHGRGAGDPAARQARGRITAVEPVGHYAVRLRFDDGHDTGLYTWAYLRELGETRDAKWQHYLDRLAKLGIPYPTPVPARR